MIPKLEGHLGKSIVIVGAHCGFLGTFPCLYSYLIYVFHSYGLEYSKQCKAYFILFLVLYQN